MCVGGGYFGSTYLIFYDCVANIFDQSSKFIRILDVIDKALGLSLLDQWLKFSENVFQFPDKLSLLDSALDLRERELTVPTPPSWIAPSCRLQRRVCKAGQKGF